MSVVEAREGITQRLRLRTLEATDDAFDLGAIRRELLRELRRNLLHAPHLAQELSDHALQRGDIRRLLQLPANALQRMSEAYGGRLCTCSATRSVLEQRSQLALGTLKGFYIARCDV